MDKKDYCPGLSPRIPSSLLRVNLLLKMCRQIVEFLFYNCGHVVRTEVQSINLECSQVVEVMQYYDDRFCQRCIWGIFEPQESLSKTLSLPCNGQKRRVWATIQYNVDHWNAASKEDLRVKRVNLVAKFNMWQIEMLQEKLQGRYLRLREDEIARHVPIQHQLFYLGPGRFDKNFLQRIEAKEAPDHKEICFCGFSVKAPGIEGCDGGGPCNLPCGHIFGYNCVLAWMEKSDRCPLCASLIRIFRVDAELGSLEEFLEPLPHDHDPNTWRNNLRSLLNSQLIYVVILQMMPMFPMAPWTNPRTIFLVSLWIPFGLCFDFALFHSQRSPGLSRLKEGLTLAFPEWIRILLFVQQTLLAQEIRLSGCTLYSDGSLKLGFHGRLEKNLRCNIIQALNRGRFVSDNKIISKNWTRITLAARQ